MLGNQSSGQHFSERSHDRTLTPQGVNGNSAGQVPQVFDEGKSSAFPWPVEDNQQEPFNTSGMCLNYHTFFNSSEVKVLTPYHFLSLR